VSFHVRPLRPPYVALHIAFMPLLGLYLEARMHGRFLLPILINALFISPLAAQGTRLLRGPTLRIPGLPGDRAEGRVADRGVGCRGEEPRPQCEEDPASPLIGGGGRVPFPRLEGRRDGLGKGPLPGAPTR